jgi:hypothetical protein
MSKADNLTSLLNLKISLIINKVAAANAASLTKHIYNILFKKARHLSTFLSALIALKMSEKYYSRLSLCLLK